MDHRDLYNAHIYGVFSTFLYRKWTLDQFAILSSYIFSWYTSIKAKYIEKIYDSDITAEPLSTVG